MALFWTAFKKDSVSLAKCSFYSDINVFSWAISSVQRLKYLYRSHCATYCLCRILSPWKIPLWIYTFARVYPPDIYVDLQFSMANVMKFLILWDFLNVLIYSVIHDIQGGMRCFFRSYVKRTFSNIFLNLTVFNINIHHMFFLNFKVNILGKYDNY